jgi:dephospho-CoA kinase
VSGAPSGLGWAGYWRCLPSRKRQTAERNGGETREGGLDIAQIATAIQRKHGAQRPLLIAIEGYGGSGKTTVARQLAIALGNACVVAVDDFIVKDKLCEPSWDSGVFDRDRLERQVLAPGRNGQPMRYQRLDWATNTLGEPVEVADIDYLIVEGITAYHPTIERYYDVKIWIETPLKLAAHRGRARDGSAENSAHWELWARNDRAYQRRYHPKRRADYICRNA